MTVLSTSAGTVACDSLRLARTVEELLGSLPGQAGTITAPAVLIWGRDDAVLSLRAAETARDLIPGSGLVVIESGHIPHTASPAAVAAEFTSLAYTAFDGGRTNRPQNGTPATKEQQ